MLVVYWSGQLRFTTVQDGFVVFHILCNERLMKGTPPTPKKIYQIEKDEWKQSLMTKHWVRPLGFWVTAEEYVKYQRERETWGGLTTFISVFRKGSDPKPRVLIEKLLAKHPWGLSELTTWRLQFTGATTVWGRQRFFVCRLGYKKKPKRSLSVKEKVEINNNVNVTLAEKQRGRWGGGRPCCTCSCMPRLPFLITALCIFSGTFLPTVLLATKALQTSLTKINHQLLQLHFILFFFFCFILLAPVGCRWRSRSSSICRLQIMPPSRSFETHSAKLTSAFERL